MKQFVRVMAILLCVSGVRGVAQQMPPAPREHERGGQHSDPVQAERSRGHGQRRGHDDGRDRTDHDHAFYEVVKNATNKLTEQMAMTCVLPVSRVWRSRRGSYGWSG